MIAVSWFLLVAQAMVLCFNSGSIFQAEPSGVLALKNQNLFFSIP
jgi:hypothetical protein